MIEKRLTVEETAQALGVQPRVVRRRINAGTIKATKYPGRSGGEYRITETDLQEYIDSMGLKR
ncbi:helix-turn-helix domain-containing protein [Methanoregula sp.]|jgi:excisionase family DNA binding protein|uniref:helix-turn-helix domain-containing protein n=1 Tax=Methanoregula sp. TaxID=2052170 RepID=UPI0035697969